MEIVNRCIVVEQMIVVSGVSLIDIVDVFSDSSRRETWNFEAIPSGRVKEL